VSALRTKVVGVDLSLSGTGLGLIVDGAPASPDTLIPVAGTDLQRIRLITRSVLNWCYGSTLTVVEGASYASNSGHAHTRAGLWWMVYDALNRADIPVAVMTPTGLKRYATGKGNANKAAVCMAAARRWPDLIIPDDNAADALWLACAGADHLGWPPVALPATHRTALDHIDWPEGLT
jgi:crossover junction endodeoxyribonuclease RuvC